ncbi:MAG: DUF4426 domain-containing protein [Luteimonas sp.]|nr:DUF4426 domain-containing protein [Luteimonas sp.]
MRRTFALSLATFACLLAACGGQRTGSDEIAMQLNAAREPAEAQAGDLLVRASIAPTAALPEAIASRYGVRRDPRGVLLLAGLRRVDGAQETSLPATLSVEVRDLRGVRRNVPLREVRLDGFIDYVGEVRAAPPDTLTFDVVAEDDDGNQVELRFSRDLFPPQR